MTLGGVFGSNVMFRPPLGTLTSFIANFQLTDVLHRGGHMAPHRKSVGLEPIGDRVKYCTRCTDCVLKTHQIID